MDDPPRIDSWEKAAGLTFGARIPQTLQVRGCIDAMWDLPFGMSVDELRAPSAHDPAYATLAARLLGAPVWDALRGEGAEPQACYTLGPEATLKRLMELYFPQPDVAAFAAAAHAAGDALREAAQGGVSWATIHLALTILQYLPPAISVREHAAVGALLADSVIEVLAMAAHTLACIGPQAVAEHYEEMIEIASDPESPTAAQRTANGVALRHKGGRSFGAKRHGCVSRSFSPSTSSVSKPAAHPSAPSPARHSLRAHHLPSMSTNAVGRSHSVCPRQRTWSRQWIWRSAPRLTKPTDAAAVRYIRYGSRNVLRGRAEREPSTAPLKWRCKSHFKSLVLSLSLPLRLCQVQL